MAIEKIEIEFVHQHAFVTALKAFNQIAAMIGDEAGAVLSAVVFYGDKY